MHRLRAPVLRAAARDVDDGVLVVMREGAQARARAHQARTGERVIDDDDELDAAAPFLEHDWQVEGEREVGGVLRRCRRCGVLGHWPAAHATCVVILSRVSMVSSALGPLHEGQWPGPYVEGVEPTCVICERRYRRNVRHGNSSTCSAPCSATLKRAANRAQAQRLRAAKREQRR